MSRTEYFFYITTRVISFIVIFSWIAGIAAAKGAWSTLFAIMIAPYAWYLFIDKAMLHWFG